MIHVYLSFDSNPLDSTFSNRSMNLLRVPCSSIQKLQNLILEKLHFEVHNKKQQKIYFLTLLFDNVYPNPFMQNTSVRSV